MIVKQMYLAVPETYREQNILMDVVGLWYPPGPRTPPTVGTDGVEFSVCGTFQATEEQMARVKIELAKSDEQRKAEWLAAPPKDE